jgi:mRNA-degrading endonuclease YafQ of YafQ-DinJ toxin-antitoxin module
MNLVWTARFARSIKRAAGPDRRKLEAIEKTLQLLADDCRHASLRTHKLKGDLRGCWLVQQVMIFEYCSNL